MTLDPRVLHAAQRLPVRLTDGRIGILIAWPKPEAGLYPYCKVKFVHAIGEHHEKVHIEKIEEFLQELPG
jgi:hypothetical protein